MKTYLLIAADFIKTGGMDRANFGLAEYLVKQGHQVNLVAHKISKELLSFGNVKFYKAPKILNSDFLSSPSLNLWGLTKAHELSAQRASVIVNGGNCKWGDINWVHYVHAAHKPNNKSHWLLRLKSTISHLTFLRDEKQAFNIAKIIIANSERTKKDLVNLLSVPPEKIRTIYYGIDPTIFNPAFPTEKQQLRQQLGWPTETPIVTFIGALGDRRKGFDTLFQAWQKLCADSTWDANLMVIGRGVELPLWQERTEKLGLSQRIQFLGFRTDVPDLLRAADCLVAPTRYEAYGLGVHEALCCGLPAIVSADSGVAERYPDSLKELLLPNPENVEDLQSRLQKWRYQIDYYQQLVLPFAEHLRNYSWDDMAREITNLIDLDSAK